VATSRAAERDIERLEHELMDAVRHRDLLLLGELLGGDFTLTTGRPGAEVRSREEYLAITEHEYAVEEYAFEGLVVQHYGDCAVVRTRYRQRGRMGDQRRHGTYRITDVWVRGARGWQLQARHAQPLAGD
jgi:ketosteroid isomerase-like protein